MQRAPFESLLCAALALLFAASLLRHLDAPLLWNDEGDTAMFATRILEVGYPKVHGDRNVLYEFAADPRLGIDEATDAFIGKTWGDFYFAVPGVWLAQRTPDPRARTFRVRLPFALAGLGGVAAWLWAVWPALPADARRRARFACGYVALCALSISLTLHLREARYYALLVLGAGAWLGVHLRGAVLGTLAGWRYALATALCASWVFHVFFAAWFPLLGLCAADAALQALRSAPPAARVRSLARALAPHALAVLLALPALFFFDSLSMAARLSAELGASAVSWWSNLRGVLAHFARQEWLVAALLARAAAAWLARGAPEAQRAATHSARAVAARLLVFAAGYAAVLCVNPLVYERYFVVWSPALAAGLALDVSSAASLLAARPRRLRAACAAALCLALAGSLAARRDALAGRVAELIEPVHGPLDFAVESLRRRYEDPASLLIATNYEAQPLMFYLGSRVIVGLALGNLADERGLVPDVVIPRRRWPRSLAELRPFLANGRWEEEALPVQDVHTNETPSLTPSPSNPDPHRFVTPWSAPGDRRALHVFHRVKD
jgi:hypothetical protein